MPIKVTCQCGKSFAAKDELAGKAVKCPNCQQPLRIPAAGLAAPLPSAAPPQAASAPAARASATPMQPAPAAPAAGSLFDEVGLEAAPAGAALCPGCAQALPPNAVICVKCGYNLKLGRRMQTMVLGADGMPTGAGGHGAHDAATVAAMNRAAMAIEEDKEAERSKTKEGLPWWAYLIGLIMVTGFIVLMMLIPAKHAILVGAFTIFAIAQLVQLYAQIRILIIAFSESFVQGLLILLVPCGIYYLIYVITRWERCGGYFIMSFISGAIAGAAIGGVMAASGMEGGMGGGQDGVYRLPQREPSVLVASCDSTYRQMPVFRPNAVG